MSQVRGFDFGFEHVPQRFAVLILEDGHIDRVADAFLTWDRAQVLVDAFNSHRGESAHWAIAMPQPVSRATFSASSLSRFA